MPRTWWNTGNDAELVELYKTHTAAELGERYGLSDKGIIKQLKRLGVALRRTGPRGKEMTSEQRMAVITRLARNQSLTQIETETGVCRKTLRSIAKRDALIERYLRANYKRRGLKYED